MTRENNEELRSRLLADEGVQQMIRVRAYELYERRGGGHGNEAEDWLQAESEVLLYLIAQQQTAASPQKTRRASPRAGTKSTSTRKKKTEAAGNVSGEAEAKPKKTQKAKKKKEE